LGRTVFLPAVAFVVLGTASAYAFGGGPNLPPVDSPYAILEPQTVAPLSKQPSTETHSDRMGHAPRRLLRRHPSAEIR
jgi:hypothetical protein